MIQAGSDWTACSELANATRDEVEDNVKSKQDMLDNLDKGCGCAALGQDEVTRTVNEMNAALNAATVAETALETATNAQVQLSSQSFQFLQSGECGWIMTDSSYQTAHLTYNTAVTKLATAKTTYTLSVTAHTEAVTEAARLKLECECATQSAHAVAWADANADNDANAAAWAKAHHIDCVVDHIAEADCSFGPAPGLTQPTLCDDIESVSCAAESGSAAPVAPETAAPETAAPETAAPETATPTVAPTGTTAVNDMGASGCTSSNKCGQCEGDIHSDADCRTGLMCFQRTSSSQTVPGCQGSGYVKSSSDHDYCYSEPPADTADWSNGNGFTCEGYKTRGWCVDGHANGYKGNQFNFPEHNCIVCGKGN